MDASQSASSQLRGLNWPVVLSGLLLITFGLGLAVTRTAEAQGVPIAASRGAFAGVPPRDASNPIALLLTTVESTPADLTRTLFDTGCDVETIFVLGLPTGPLPAGAPTPPPSWAGFVAGAPAAVNAFAPSSIPATTPFFVRCRGVVAAQVNPAASSYLIDGSATPLSANLRLSTRQSFGPLDGSPTADGAAILAHSTGGSGTFIQLAGLTGGDTAPAPTVFLGDRVVVEDLRIARGKITVTYLDRAPGEPMAIPGSISVTRSFFLRNHELIEVGGGGCAASDLDDLGGLVIVTAPVSGAEVSSGFSVTGCSRTFESTFSWRLLAGDGTVLASGSSMGGGVDGTEPFNFTVTYAVSTRQLAHLEVFEQDVSGLGQPRPRDHVPVILLP